MVGGGGARGVRDGGVSGVRAAVERMGKRGCLFAAGRWERGRGGEGGGFAAVLPWA